MKQDREKDYYIVKNKISMFFRLRDLLLTLLLWGLWVYIFYPLIALILWKFFNIDIFYNYSQEEIKALSKSLYLFIFFAGTMILLLVSAFVGWGYYNKKRFEYRGNKRRKQPKAVSSKMMAKSLQVDPRSIEKSKESKYVQIYHTKESPKSTEDLFKPIDDLNVTNVNIYFSDDWDRVRESSNFGYTHIEIEETPKSSNFKKNKDKDSEG